jgi:DHA2 family multidrug resistance protein
MAATTLDATHDLDPSYPYRWIIAVTVTLASILEILDTSIVNVAIPHMMGSLGATLDQITWVSTGYIVANVIVLPVTGWMSAYFGRRRYFAGSIALFTVASVLCGNAHTLTELVVFRIIQGLGGGALLSTAQATLYEVFPPEEYGGAMAIFGLGVMVGPTLGPTLGGWITDTWSWPWIFYINVPFGILAFIMSLGYIRNSRFARRVESVDWTGLALLAVGIGMLQTMLERGERLDWFDSREIVFYAVTSALSLAGFVWHELHTPHPVIDLRIFANRQFGIQET